MSLGTSAYGTLPLGVGVAAAAGWGTTTADLSDSYAILQATSRDLSGGYAILNAVVADLSDGYTINGAATTLTAADLAAIDALIVARVVDIAAAVLAAAQVTPIHADVRKINGGNGIIGSGRSPTFDGTGTMTDPGDPWRPAP